MAVLKDFSPVMSRCRGDRVLGNGDLGEGWGLK